MCIYILLSVTCCSCAKEESVEIIIPDLPEVIDEIIPIANPHAKLLYNGIALPSMWPPYSSYTANIYAGMSPFYLRMKPDIINIELGRQLFVDDFLIQSSDLSRH